MKIGAFITICLLFTGHSYSQRAMNHTTPDSEFLASLLAQQGAPFDSFITNKNALGIQVIYTQIDRTKKNKPKFTHHYYNVSDSTYFYPASTVKFPIVVLALQKLNELHIAGLDKYTTMVTEAGADKQTEVYNDPSAMDGKPCIAHYIRKILLVSDNDAFNRLYEFLGQEYINNTLHRMGYTDVEIIHRLSILLTDEQNRCTNPVRFVDTSGNVLYEKKLEKSNFQYAPRDIKMGKGFIRGDQLVNEPFDFSRKNKLPLQSLHSIVMSVLFPEVTDKEQQFLLTADDLAFLRRYMSMRPFESVSPVYTAPDYWNNYTKLLYYGSAKQEPDTNIRIFNKTGWAYGFLTDAAYFMDYDNKVEFFLSATIYCNSDGIFNDDKYDAANVGYPFMRQLGRAIYEYERKRPKKNPPVLDTFLFDYNKRE
jgi:hypothetical protein